MPKSVSRGKPRRNAHYTVLTVNSENGDFVNVCIVYVPKCVDYDSFTNTLKELKESERGTWEEGTVAGKKVWICRDLPKAGTNGRYGLLVLMPITETRWAIFRVSDYDSNRTLCERAIEAAVENFEVMD